MYKLLMHNELPKCESDSAEGLPKEYRVGLEVELENIKDSEVPKNYKWLVEDDGSLKVHGREFIFKRPLSGSAIEVAMNQLDKILSKNEASASSRTSVHVHIDVLDMSREQLIDFIRVYTILEKVLYRVGGFHRYTNNNCLPIGSSDQLAHTVSSLKGSIDNDAHFIRTLMCCKKYSGCNLRSIVFGIDDGLKGRGSLEFRMHEGTTDTVRIVNWIKVLLKVKKYAMENPVDDLVTDFSMMGPINLLTEVFEEMYPYVFEQADVDEYTLGEDLYEGARNLQFVDQYRRVLEDGNDYLTRCYNKVHGGWEEDENEVPNDLPVDLAKFVQEQEPNNEVVARAFAMRGQEPAEVPLVFGAVDEDPLEDL
jgi:hypothetical protein